MRKAILAAGVILLTIPSSARQIQDVGTPTSLDVATWNVEWFGSTGGGPSNEAVQFNNVVSVIEQSGMDLWALQEVSSPTVFDQLLATLGSPWAGDLASVNNSGSQNVAFVYRTDVVQKGTVGHILTEFSPAFAGRPPLRLQAVVTLPDTTLTVVLVTVHMKCCSGATDFDKRLEASQRLKNRFDFTSDAWANLVLLGDLNDELLTSITPGMPSPYENFVSDPTDYRFLTMPLEIDGTCTYCGGSQTSTIDHVLVSDELFDAADRGSTERMSTVLTGISGFLSNTSDHVPVFTRLQLASPSPVEKKPRLAELSVYPLPARSYLTVDLGEAASRPGDARIVDMLGRERLVQALRAGDRRLSLDVSELPPGLYILVLPGGSQVVPVVR